MSGLRTMMLCDVETRNLAKELAKNRGMTLRNFLKFVMVELDKKNKKTKDK